jgi:glycine/D-amino acid oxidase-like deaminating enzyme
MDLKSGYPFLLVKHGLPFDYPKLEQDLKIDVVIIGSGISGSLSAYYLAKAGFDCAVMDARTVGLGSTCASTSLLQYEFDMPLSELKDQIGIQSAGKAYQICSDAIDRIEEICTEISFGDFSRRKSLYYASFKKDVSFLKEEIAIRKQFGFDVEFLGKSEIQKLYGFSAPAAILSGQGAEINAYSFTHALLQAALKRGLRVYDRTKVTSIQYKQKGVELLTENGCKIHAKKIVNAMGYEVQNMIPGIATLNSTYAICSEQLSVETIWKDNDLIWNTADPYLYMRTTGDHRIIVGGRDEEFYNPVARDRLLAIKSKQLLKDFNKIFPGIELNPEFTWTGTFGSTPDSLPYIGKFPKFPHTYFALGFGGNGITSSLIAAQIICDLMQNKPNKDSELFSFKRRSKRKAPVN